jgi:hypothetical protein
MPTTVTGLTEFQGRLRVLPQQVERVALRVFTAWAPRLQDWMRANHLWTNRTGAAERGLTARAESGGGQVRLIVAHSVTYGLWLEVRWQGRFAILEPAIRQFWPQIQRDLVQAFQAQFGGVWRVA